MAGWRSELACCRSTLSMSKIKVRISETKKGFLKQRIAPFTKPCPNLFGFHVIKNIFSSIWLTRGPREILYLLVFTRNPSKQNILMNAILKFNKLKKTHLHKYKISLGATSIKIFSAEMCRNLQKLGKNQTL